MTFYMLGSGLPISLVLGVALTGTIHKIDRGRVMDKPDAPPVAKLIEAY